MDEKQFLQHGFEQSIFPLFTKSDMARRWGMTTPGVQKRAKMHDDFPKPVDITVRDYPLYPLCEVLRYEKVRGVKY